MRMVRVIRVKCWLIKRFLEYLNLLPLRRRVSIRQGIPVVGGLTPSTVCSCFFADTSQYRFQAMVYVPPPSSVYPFPTLRLSWSEPDDDGGDDIISFELRVWTPPSDDTPININSTSPVNTVYTGPALHYTVTFRYGPTFYAFLRARNSYQWSAWSSPTSFQLSFSPETPVLSTFGISPSGFSGMFIGLLCLTYCAAVQWTAPYDNGAPITGYEFSTIDCHGLYHSRVLLFSLSSYYYFLCRSSTAIHQCTCVFRFHLYCTSTISQPNHLPVCWSN